MSLCIFQYKIAGLSASALILARGIT